MLLGNNSTLQHTWDGPASCCHILQDPGQEMDDIEKELELLIDEEVRLEAEQVRKRREAEQAAAEALKAVAGKRPLDEVSTEVGSTGAGSSLKKTRVGQEEPQGPTDEHLAQQQLELKQLEEEGDRLQRLLLEKQQEVLLEKQRQEEQKAREAAEKKKREEAEQRAREKAAAEERAVREREEARRSAELLLKQEQERKRKETEDLLSAKKARVLELKRQLGQEVAKLQVEKEPTPPLRRSSAFDEASLHGADPASVPESQAPVATPTPPATPASVPKAVPQTAQTPPPPASLQLRAPSEQTPSETSDASTKVLGAHKKKWEDATWMIWAPAQVLTLLNCRQIISSGDARRGC